MSIPTMTFTEIDPKMSRAEYLSARDKGMTYPYWHTNEINAGYNGEARYWSDISIEYEDLYRWAALTNTVMRQGPRTFIHRDVLLPSTYGTGQTGTLVKTCEQMKNHFQDKMFRHLYNKTALSDERLMKQDKLIRTLVANAEKQTTMTDELTKTFDERLMKQDKLIRTLVANAEKQTTMTDELTKTFDERLMKQDELIRKLVGKAYIQTFMMDELTKKADERGLEVSIVTKCWITVLFIVSTYATCYLDILRRF